MKHVNFSVPAQPLGALALKSELAAMHRLKKMSVAGCSVEVCEGRDSVWVLVRRPDAGGFALRTAYSPGTPLKVKAASESEQALEWEAAGALGRFRVDLEIPAADKAALRCTVRLTPAADLLLPAWPRDLYPLDAHGDPAGAKGAVHAAQRGLNTGLVYLSLSQPRFGSLLYVQNLTALNDYFAITETLPDGCVGGLWPELGYLPPTSESKPLSSGREITVSDVFLQWSDVVPQTPQKSARLFLDLLAGVYARMERPAPQYRDWPRKAKETLHDLEHAPEATIQHYGHVYLHPYTAAEYPDSMVQLTVLTPLREYAAWRGRALPFVDALKAGVPRFFDAKLGAIRRYLPNVGEDKNPDEVDSWYLYHPLANLARLAKAGDEKAKALFLGSLDFGIQTARHFKYQWPVQFNIQTLEIITSARKPDEPGQSDVGGLFAYVMMQAHDLTGEGRYLQEAQNAMAAVRDMEFELDYQSNITAWGANACLRLFRQTGDAKYQAQSEVFLANFFHNSLIWESEIAAAKYYSIFLGVTCLHNGPYMALYECYESFASFHEYLAWGQSDLPDSVQLLLTEYCKYTLSRAWSYYPKELPAEILAPEVRNGHIDRALAFPLEDLYAAGQPAGQVGQEIYGCGAAFAFTTRAYHRIKNAPFQLFCAYPIFDLEQTDEPCLSFQARGVEGFSCQARIIPAQGKSLPPITVHGSDGSRIKGRHTPEGHWDFTAPAAQTVKVRWRLSEQ